MDTHFWDVYRDVRSLIKKPEEALYILHTSIGAISVRRFVYRGEAGFVFLQGIDESGKDRILGFSEQQLSTFPFEIRMKSNNKNDHMMFNPHVAENLPETY
jgi:hypothetical protein